RAVERQREERLVCRAGADARQIDDLDRRQLARTGPRREREQRVLAARREVERLERRRRAAEDRQRARAVRPEDREIARVVSEALFLLVGRVVLLVDDDDAEVLERREERRASTDRQRQLAGTEPRP